MQITILSLTKTQVPFFRSGVAPQTMTVGTVTNAGLTYIGSDASDDGSAAPLAGNPVPVSLTTTNKLLFRLNLTGVTAGTYTLTVDPNSANTAFFTDQLDPVTTTIDCASITLNSGQVHSQAWRSFDAENSQLVKPANGMLNRIS